MSFIVVLLVAMVATAGLVQVAYADAAGDKDAAKGAQPAAKHSATDLAEQTQNPVASLISVPMESNFNFGVGQADNFQYVMNVKPVIPQKLNKDWNWIHRGIQPIIAQDNLTSTGMGLETDDPIFGMGDLTYQGFMTPGKARQGYLGCGWCAGCAVG